MRTIVAFLILGCLFAMAAQPQENVDALKQRIDQSPPSDQIKLSIEVARAQLQHMTDLYNANDNENARKALQDVEKYGVLAANKAADVRKHQKDTEIAVRRLSSRLGEIVRDADIDERPVIKAAIAKLDKAHDDLLSSMFKKK